MKPDDSASDKKKRRELLVSARLGVREAQYALGLMYVNGTGGEQDVNEAVVWIRQAAEKGLPAAQYALGARLAAGLMGERDDLAAYDWFARAAEQGHARAVFRLAKLTDTAHLELAAARMRKAAQLGLAEAQLELGKALASGRGVEHDHEAAFDWIQKAAAQGLAAAQHHLAGLHADGRGTPVDLHEALRWYRKAAAQDHPAAVLALHDLDAQGLGRGAEAHRPPLPGSPSPAPALPPGLALPRSPQAADRRRDGRRWLHLADPGDAESRYALGQLLAFGIEAPCDPVKARAWFSLAARQDDPRAQAALAHLLEQAGDVEVARELYQQAAAQGERDAQAALGRLDSGHPGDPEKAFSSALWYLHAAEGGDPTALLTLARLFGERQEPIARHCLRQAAEQGVAPAQFLLGRLQANADGDGRNARSAADWYRRAAEQGDPQAQCALALCHLAGQGVAQSSPEALRWLLAAAEQGDAQAQWNLGALHASGGEGVAPDLEQAFRWCHKAADQGYPAAQATLGLLYAGIDQPERAVLLWSAAAEAGDGEAQYNLGLLLAQGRGCVRDARAAFGWFALAAEHGIRQAQSRLAILFAEGDGVARDPIEAHKWFVIAARAGDAPARANRGQSQARLDADQVDEGVRRADAWKAAQRAAGVAQKAR